MFLFSFHDLKSGETMRLDKFLCDNGYGTRSQVKQLIKKGHVLVNGGLCKEAEHKIDNENDSVTVDGKECRYTEFIYYMFHKPADCVCAVKDNVSRTVMEYLAKEDLRKDLFPVGRLDKDTEGLLLITNDGALSHKMLSPKKHVPKTYYVKLKKALSDVNVNLLETGVDIGDEKKTLPAIVKILDRKEILLTISEGRFHQIKRMLLSVGNEVTYLKRISMGGLFLDENLKPGEYRPLTGEELKKLC